jgi:uncharacterized cupredoxin-like copper-binding protein
VRSRLISAAVAVAVLVTATACGSSEDDKAVSPSGPPVEIVLSDFMIMPHDFTASAGSVIFRVRNSGQAPHDFAVRDASNKPIAKTKTLQPGDEVELTMQLPAGEYGVYCSVAGHESLGMKGNLRVS